MTTIRVAIIEAPSIGARTMVGTTIQREAKRGWWRWDEGPSPLPSIGEAL